MSRRTFSLILPLLALVAGCRAFVAEDPRTHVRIAAVSLMTSPKIGHATVTVQTPTTRETFDLSDYASTSNVTGADLANIASTLLKGLVGLP
jgi:hypothetical protein